MFLLMGNCCIALRLLGVAECLLPAGDDAETRSCQIRHLHCSSMIAWLRHHAVRCERAASREVQPVTRVALGRVKKSRCGTFGCSLSPMSHTWVGRLAPSPIFNIGRIWWHAARAYQPLKRHRFSSCQEGRGRRPSRPSRPPSFMERLAAEVAQRPFREEDARRLHRSQAALFRAKSRELQARLNAIREAKWDASPHRSCPSNLRGLKPITPEPWARDALVYAQKTGSFEQIMNGDNFGDGTQAAEEYNDESILDSHNGYRSTITATGLKKNASLGGQPLWDSSPLRHTVRTCRRGL